MAEMPLFQPVERRFYRVLEQGDIAEFMAEHQRQPGQEQRLALGPGRIDGRCQRLVGGLEIR